MPMPLQPDGRTYTLFPAVVRRCDFHVPEVNEALYHWVKQQQADPAVPNACDVRDVATVRGYQPDIVLHESLGEMGWWQRLMSTVVHPTIQSWLAEHCRLSGWPRPGTGYGFKASWTVLYPADSFQAPHFHPGTFCTLAYYARMPERPAPEGALRFINPHLESHFTPTCAWSYHEEFVPAAGTAIVFPGWLQHYSYPHRGDGERQLLTFDVELLPPRDQGPAQQ